MPSTAAKVVGPADGKAGSIGAIGVRFMVDGDESGGGFSLVEHPMPAHALAAPMHRHSREDEYSFVLEGRVGALLGDELVFGDARVCFKGSVDKIEVTGAYGHGTYVRVYVLVTARANVSMPCAAQ